MLTSNLTILLLSILLATTLSCSKQKDEQIVGAPASSRTIRFQLYTTKDFSSEENSIQFTLSIKSTSTNQVIWDSTLAPLKIKDLPGSSNKLIYEKTISGNDPILKAGFYYTIPNVGNSWYLDTCRNTTTLKIIDFNFQ